MEAVSGEAASFVCSHLEEIPKPEAHLAVAH